MKKLLALMTVCILMLVFAVSPVLAEDVTEPVDVEDVVDIEESVDIEDDVEVDDNTEGSVAGAVNNAAQAISVVIRYEDGCDGQVFKGERFMVSLGEPTPEYPGATPSREGFTFEGWTPAWEAMAERNVVYVAQWAEIPVEEPEDASSSTVVGTDESGDTVTSVTANTDEETAGTSNEGRGDVIGSDVDTGDISPVAMVGGFAVALVALIGLFIWQKKRSSQN